VSVDQDRAIVVITGVPHWGVEAVDLLLIKVRLLDLLKVSWAEQARDVVENEAVLAVAGTSASAPTPRCQGRHFSLGLKPAQVSSLENEIERSLHGEALDDVLEEEDAGAQTGLGVAMVELKDPVERRLGDLSNCDVVLPLEEGFLCPLLLDTLEKVLCAQKRSGQELQLCLLLYGILGDLLLQVHLILVCLTDLCVAALQVLDVVRVAVLLVLEGSKLVVLERLFVLHEDHHLLPDLEHFADLSLLLLLKDVLKVSCKRTESDSELV
jgi:hypothetical protein